MKGKAHSKILAKELKKTIPLYIIGIIFHLIAIYITLLITQITGGILDLILQDNVTTEEIMKEVYKLLFWSFIVCVPNSLKRFFYYTTARKSDKVLRKAVFKKLQYVNEHYYENTEKGKFLAHLTKEITMIRKFLGNCFQSITSLIGIPVLVILVSARNLNFNLALILFIIVPITLIIIWRLYREKQKRVEEARKEYVTMSSVIEQNTSNFTLIKLYNNQEEQQEIFTKENKKMQEKDYKVGKIDSSIDNVTNISEAACYILMVTYGIFLITQGKLTIGDLSIFTAFISKIFSSTKKNIRDITNGIVYYTQAVHRIDQIMNIPTYMDHEIGKQIIAEIDSIKVKNLSYQYPTSSKYAIKNINFEIHRKDKIGIIGMFGSGKTTLMNIISGFYEIGKNQVFINDIDITNVDKYSLFNNISYILQKDTLINDTIKNNITLENNYDGKRIIQATNDADILEEIFKMEHEFEEKVGEKGVKLSGGQKQRISIARNLIVDKNFIIFDDSFSALDHNTEKEVLKNVLNADDKTIIIIANKVTDVKDLDKIYLMVDGEFIDCGRHDELLARSDIYKEMYEYEMAGERID